MRNLKEYGRKQSWPLAVLFWHMLAVTEREPRNLRIVGVLAEIRTGLLVYKSEA